MRQRIAYYLRADPGQAYSLNFQKALLDRFVARYGQLSKGSVELYCDCCDSFSNLGPEHERLTQDVKDGKIDVVIVADIGRICRCALELEAFLNLMELRHFRFISAGDHLDINGWPELQQCRADFKAETKAS